MSNIYNPYDLEPFEPTHPGELLGDELEARGLTQRKFAETIGISCSVLNEVIKGKRPVTPELAFKIEAATGTKAYIFGWNFKPNITIGQPGKAKNSLSY